FRNADHADFMECGDQVLRNFLNGLVIHLRGTKENPKNAMDVIKQNQEAVKKNILETRTKGELSRAKTKEEFKPKADFTPNPKTDFKKKPFNPKYKKSVPKVQVVEKVQFKNGKNKK
ncbi:MAG: DUF1456 family protein, partial [Flavobacterium sp.]